MSKRSNAAKMSYASKFACRDEKVTITTRQTKKVRRQLRNEDQVQAFLDAGGEIQQIPMGVTRDSLDKAAN